MNFCQLCFFFYCVCCGPLCVCLFICMFFFFKQKTAYDMRISDWSSDVCSSDLGGNHSWDQREVMSYIGSEPRLLRPQNFPAGTPGRGAGVFETRRGKKVLVMNVMGQLFMEDLDDPFACIAAELARHRLGATVDAAVLDFHAEASSEKKIGRAHV